ncbi:MAG: complex I NDUFA9 subunit family protein [bacterium]
MASSKKIFVTGASGFVGREICRKLLDDGYSVTALLRQGSSLPYSLQKNDRIAIRRGNVTSYHSFADAMKDHHAVINLVGIIREFPKTGITFKNLHVNATRNVIHAAQEAGVKRFLQMSALGTTRYAVSEYHKTKWEGETIVRKSGLDYSIFRPSIIYGEHDNLTNMIADMIRKFRTFPLIGGGKTLLQPISVEDIAYGFVNSIDKLISVGKTYDVGGFEKIRFSDMVGLIARALGKSVFLPIVPVFMVKPVVKAMQNKSWFPLTTTQLQMLLEDNITDDTMFKDDLKLITTPFKEGISQYLSPQLKKENIQFSE